MIDLLNNAGSLRGLTVMPAEGGYFSGTIHPHFVGEFWNLNNRLGFYRSRKLKRVRRPWMRMH